jgi:TP901 family phage tail tape measure protein
MRPFQIPSIYTVVDKFTAPIRKMAGASAGFASSIETGAARGERMFRKLTPAISESTRQMFAWARSAAIAGAVVGGITFSTGALMDYETQLNSFRTIVSDLSDKDFAKYQSALNQVALDTRKSAIDTAMAAEKIAGLNAKFAETSDGISAVTKAAITLSKASRDELGTSAESLVGIMNQFNFGADQANRTVNALAAGTAVGASSIKQTAEAFVNFGAVASSANITLEQSVGLIQTMGKFSIFGSEAGNKLKGVILRLQKAGVGYASGQFNINDALLETQKRLDKLKTPLQKDRMLIKLFGAENISAGKSLVGSIGLFNEFSTAIGGNTTAAMDQAAINSDTLRNRLDELRNTWINLLVSNEGATDGLTQAKKAIGFVTDNLSTIISVGVKVLAFFAAWKAILLLTRAGLVAYNVALGIYNAVTGTAAVYTNAQTIAMNAQAIAARVVTAAQWAWNIAMSANPIGLIIIGVAALIGLITIIVRKWNDWGAALSVFLGPIGLVLSAIMSIRRNWDMIVSSFQEGGILGGIKAIGKVLFDAILQPVQQIVSLIGKITGAQWAKDASASIEAFRKGMGVNVEPVINPKQTQQEATNSTIENIQKQQVGINIKDETGKAEVQSSKGFANVKLSTTWGQ